MREPTPKPVIRPSMRATSKMNIKRAAETRRSEQRTEAADANSKRMTSPTSRVTKHPEGHKSGSAPYVPPVRTVPTPSERAGSKANIRRAAETRRAGQRAEVKASAARTKKSVATGAANKVKAMPKGVVPTPKSKLFPKATTITPAMRAGSKANIRRAGEKGRVAQRKAASVSAARTKSSVMTGAANKVRRFA